MQKRGYHDFSFKIFRLTVPKNFVEVPFCAVFQKISGREKYFMDKRGGITIFRRSFCLTVLKYFIGEHFGVSEKFFYRKFLNFHALEGGHHGFSEIFCLTGPKGKVL